MTYLEPTAIYLFRQRFKETKYKAFKGRKQRDKLFGNPHSLLIRIHSYTFVLAWNKMLMDKSVDLLQALGSSNKRCLGVMVTRKWN